MKIKHTVIAIRLEPEGNEKFKCVPQNGKKNISNKPSGYFSEFFILYMYPSQPWHMLISAGFMLCIWTSMSEILHLSERERNFS